MSPLGSVCLVWCHWAYCLLRYWARHYLLVFWKIYANCWFYATKKFNQSQRQIWELILWCIFLTQIYIWRLTLYGMKIYGSTGQIVFKKKNQNQCVKVPKPISHLLHLMDHTSILKYLPICRHIGGEVFARKALVLFCVWKSRPSLPHSGEGPSIAERVKTGKTSF